MISVYEGELKNGKGDHRSGHRVRGRGKKLVGKRGDCWD